MNEAIATCILGALILSATHSAAATQDGNKAFTDVSNSYLDEVYFPYQPTSGTLAGYHQYDAKLEDFARKNIDAEIAAGDETAGLVTGQENGGADQLRGLAEAGHGSMSQDGLRAG